MNGLNELVHSLYTIRRRKAELEKSEKSTLAELKPLVDGKFDIFPAMLIHVEGLTLTRTDEVSRSISADKLLERGVSPEIVAYATRITNYYQYRVNQYSTNNNE